ncbi:carboxypeptidase-like regulatory domain-containing protein [Marinilabilia sp.]|uniref:carboxypeptidase-like regulatory domain-containing protein n=1 Tax=Marinilabilia sp. TaxID=2021252 RepID=UPI0025B8EEA3|nr:carboxypeptidase-like regulatory domain-containing protein [Marinilabilia sp.]
MKKRFLMFSGFSVLIFLCLAKVQAQKNIIATGTIYNKEDRKPLGYVQMVSFNSHLSYTSNADGVFRISLPENDSIRIVSMGFEPKTMKAVDFLNSSKTDSIFLLPASYLLNEVIVRAEERKINLNLPGNFGANVDPDAEPDKSIPTPNIGMVMSPLTLAQSVFSKEAKNQRKRQKIIAHQQELSLWEEVISSGMLRDWVEIEDNKLDSFIIFCNQHLKPSHTDNLLTLQNKILILWEEYKKK